MEVWKDIENYEGLYQASNLGNIRSLTRTIISKNGHVMRLKGRILRQSPNSRGYLMVTLSKRGIKSPKKVHNLVVETFLRRSNYDEHIHHIDECKTNNALSNLEIMDMEEHMKFHGLDTKLWEI